MAHQYPITVDFARDFMKTAAADTTSTTCCASPHWPNGSPLRKGPMARSVHTAALLHDIGESEGREDHHLRGAMKARAILRGEPTVFVEAVTHAIEAHRFRADPAPTTLEAQVLSDADKLDAIGAIGVARVYAYAGADGTALWKLPWQAIAGSKGDAVRSPDALGGDYTPVHEFVYKLDRIPDRLYTATARTIAAERQRFMRTFFDRLDEEALGEA